MTKGSLIDWKRGSIAYQSTPDTLKGGKWHYKAHGPFRVMGIIDGYAVCRFPRAMPFCVHLSDLKKTAEECCYVK